MDKVTLARNFKVLNLKYKATEGCPKPQARASVQLTAVVDQCSTCVVEHVRGPVNAVAVSNCPH